MTPNVLTETRCHNNINNPNNMTLGAHANVSKHLFSPQEDIELRDSPDVNPYSAEFLNIY